MDKKIWFFTYDFYPFIGGIWVYCYNIYKKLLEQWREDILFFSPAENALPNHIQILAWSHNSKFKNYWASIALHFQLSSIIKKYNLWLIHINWWVGSFFLMKDLWIPVIYTVHQTYHQQYTYMPNQGRQRIMYQVEKYWYRFADKIITDCGDTKINLDEHYWTQSKTTIIPCWLNLDEYEITDTKKVNKTITFVWRLAKRKWIKRLVESMQYILKKDPDVQLKIAWSWEMESELRDIVIATWVGENVEFLWFISEEKKKILIAQSSALIVPSIFEWFGIVVIEWMALGTQVIWTNSPGIRSLIKHWENWILVDYHDTDALVDAILTSISNDSTNMLSKARLDVEENYTRDIVTEKILETYDQMI